MSRRFLTLALLFLAPCSYHGLLHSSYPSRIHRQSNSIQDTRTATFRSTVPLYSSKDGKQIEIDDVMMEAESALLAAQEALSAAEASSSSSSRSSSTKQAGAARKQFSSEETKNVVSSTMGGVVLGSFLGLVALYEIPDLGLDLTVSPIIPPVLLGGILGIVGLIGGYTDNEPGKIVRSLLGVPTEAVVNAIINLFRSAVEALGLAAKRQVEKTTSDIKALPGRVADSAARKAEETVNGIVSIPSKVSTAAKRNTLKVVDDVKASVGEAVEKVTSLPRKTTERVKEKGIFAKENLPLILVPSTLFFGIVLVAAAPLFNQ